LVPECDCVRPDEFLLTFAPKREHAQCSEIDSKARLSVRPGLTGWAQIKGGRRISSDDKGALDLWYVRNVSLTLDIKIILNTVPVLIFGEPVTETAIVHAQQEMQLVKSGSRSPRSS
jgi:Bacterial sugar transferase